MGALDRRHWRLDLAERRQKAPEENPFKPGYGTVPPCLAGRDAEQAGRYLARGVSAGKGEVHDAVAKVDPGIFPGAFCKVTADLLGGDARRCNVIHADGAGSKAALAYLHYRETGDARVFHGIAQDSIVMNLDDLLCVGLRGPALIASIINRNAKRCPGEVVAALIAGAEAFLASLRDEGVEALSGGGETADLGDLTGTLTVDSCAVAVMDRAHVIANDLRPGLAIVGLASTGKASYEARENSGIGSNGLTSARHDLLAHVYAEKYPETYDAAMPEELAYCGPYRLEDPLPGSAFSVGEALLCPTRTYAPLVQHMLAALGKEVAGLVHCSGGGQTKCLRFGKGIHFVKDSLFPVPPVFRAIQKESGADWREMHQVFNMGHRMEAYLPEKRVDDLVALAGEYGIAAKRVGHTEPSPDGKQGARNSLALTCAEGGQVCRYGG